MPPIINAQGISKAFGANPLFQNVSFTVMDGDRIGLIGPNGSGKSTLLRILVGSEVPDDGEIAFRKRLRVSYVEQDSTFKSGATVRSVAENALESAKVHQTERGTRFAETLGRAGFEDLEAKPPHSPEAGRSAWPSSRRWCKRRTSCCWTNLPTTWTSPALSGWKGC